MHADEESIHASISLEYVNQFYVPTMTEETVSPGTSPYAANPEAK